MPDDQATVDALAALPGRTDAALDPAFGEESRRRLAVIREAECIGCARCIDACPVDAIVGAAGLMHTVLVDACIGCDLCREPCPVDCIDLAQMPAAGGAQRQLAKAAKTRYAQRRARLAAQASELAARPSAEEVAALLRAAADEP